MINVNAYTFLDVLVPTSLSQTFKCRTMSAEMFRRKLSKVRNGDLFQVAA
jgi:hypothetical protein